MPGGALDPGQYAYVMAEHEEWDSARAVAGPFNAETADGRQRTEDELVAIATSEKATDAWIGFRMVSEPRTRETQDHIWEPGDEQARTDGGQQQAAEDNTCEQLVGDDVGTPPFDDEDRCGEPAEGAFEVIVDGEIAVKSRYCSEHREQLQQEDLVEEVRPTDDY